MVVHVDTWVDFSTPVVFQLFIVSDPSKLAPVLGLLLLLWTVCNSTARSAVMEQSTVNNVMLHDICSQNPYGPKRYFLDEGENGTIIAKNLDYDRIISISARTYYATFYGQQQTGGNTGNRVCSVELTTCPSCSIQIQFKILNLPSCDINSNATSINKCSGCDHLTIKENYYSTPWLVCGKSSKYLQARTQDYYHSVGRTVTFSFTFSRSYEYAFLLEFASVVNTRLITARSGDQGVINSPHFPTVYPQDYSNEVKLQNIDFINSSYGGSIMLIFDDYALGMSSFIEINDGNDTRQYALGSALFRPPVVLVQGSLLYIRFFANGARASGYRATYRFINDSADMIEIPVTDCGGLVDDYGGVITMNNMSSPTAARLFDCIWLIKPLPDYQQNPKSHLLVRMEQFSSVERGTYLEIRQGLTSLSPLIETLTSDIVYTPQTLSSEYLVPADHGFYIRLRGRLTKNFKMAIAYAAFSYAECYSAKDFVCLNHRCIAADLRCDGFNHCGDDSDEQTACGKKGISPQDPSWWMTHTPKYYFPKIIDYGDFGATSFVLLVATLGVVLFIASILALLYRMSSHSQLMRERQARLEFVRSQLINNPEEREVEIENPPSYEAPPDYAEIAKLAQLEKEGGIIYETGRVSVIPTPTPGNKRRRELIRQARAQLAPGDLVSTPASSRASTPARSRHSTPQRNRVRRTPIPIVTPVHLTHLQASDSMIPNSPPPPYEINLDSPFHVARSQEGLVVPNDVPFAEVSQIQILPTEADCGCPGACGCGPPSLNASVDSSVPLLLQPLSFETQELHFQIEQSPVNDDSDEQYQQPTKQSIFQALPERKCTEAINHRLARSYFSVDGMRAPSLSKLKDFPWNKSL